MLMPTVFHENLFDDFFDPFWNDAALERAMNREAHSVFGKHGANMMKTDVKQTDTGYEVAVDLPGCKKEDVQMELSGGYLTIQAVRSHTKDDQHQNGPICAERPSAAAAPAAFMWARACAKRISTPNSRMASCASSCLHRSRHPSCRKTPI